MNKVLKLAVMGGVLGSSFLLGSSSVYAGGGSYHHKHYRHVHYVKVRDCSYGCRSHHRYREHCRGERHDRWDNHRDHHREGREARSGVDLHGKIVIVLGK